MDLQFWEAIISAVAVLLAFYVLAIGFLKVPNEMYKWNTVSVMIACLVANIFFIFCVIAGYDVSVSLPSRLAFPAIDVSYKGGGGARH